MVDTTEACEADENPADFIRTVQPVHLHLSDHAGNVKHIPAGEGEQDWAAIAKALEGYKGFYTLEPLYKFYLDEPVKKLTKAFNFISGLIGANK